MQKHPLQSESYYRPSTTLRTRTTTKIVAPRVSWISTTQQTSNHSAAVISVYVLKAMMIVTIRMGRRESKSAKDNFELI